MEYQMHIDRDRAINVQCIKCLTPVARVEIRTVFKIGFYICEQCFKRLDKPLAKAIQEEIIL